jgi:hypothetical protein
LCKPIVANEIDRKKPKLSDQKVSGIGRDAVALPANILLIGAHLVCQLTPDFFYDFRLTKQGK